MADNRQTASTLSLIAGVLSAVFAAGGLLFVTFASSVLGVFGGDVMRGDAAFVPILFALFALVVILVHAVAAVVFLMAAPRLKSDDPQVRRTWGVWTIVVGAVSLMGPVGIVIAGLGIAAGAVTLSDLNGRPT